MLYLHGYTDYFFQRHLAEHFADLGYAFYAIDLRKCGRSTRPGQTPHYTTDLARYDLELGLALDKVASEEAGATRGSVLAMAHSTGGLIMPLWLDRMNRRRDPSLARVTGLVLNSPWFDLQGHALLRNAAVTGLIGALGRLRGLSVVPGDVIDTYGASLYAGRSGEWDYDLDWKPLAGFPVRFGWLRAIRAGHRRLHRGLDVGVPAMILRSKLSVRAKRYGPEVDVADAVLDVRQIQRWAGCLGQRTTIVPIPDARHDVFLSTEPVRRHAFAELATWLDWLRDNAR